MKFLAGETELLWGKLQDMRKTSGRFDFVTLHPNRQ